MAWKRRKSERVRRVTDGIYDLMVKSYHTSALTNPMAELLSGIAIAIVFSYCDWQVAQGTLTVGEVYSFIMAFILAYDPMKRTSKVNAQFQAGLAAAERVFGLLDITPGITDAPTAPRR